MTNEHDPSDVRDDDEAGSGARNQSRESTPTESGHSTAGDQASRNQEDESPS
jgi:hypothetical protein